MTRQDIEKEIKAIKERNANPQRATNAWAAAYARMKHLEWLLKEIGDEDKLGSKRDGRDDVPLR